MELAAPNLFHNDSPWTQSATTAPAKGGGMEAGVEWEHCSQALEILAGRELEGTLQLRNPKAPVHQGREELMSWANSLAAEPATGAKSLSSDELGSFKEGKGKGIICAILGACFSCAQGETKDPFASKRISEREHTAVKSETEVFKSSLCWRSRRKIWNASWWIEYDHLKTEGEQFEALLAAVEHREKLVEKLPPVSDTVWLCMSVHYTDPETWDGGIWYNNDDAKTLENPDAKCERRKTARSRITTSITVKMLSSAQTAVTGLLPN